MDCILCKATTKPATHRLVHSSRNEHLKVILEEFVAEFYPDSVSVNAPTTLLTLSTLRKKSREVEIPTRRA